MVSKTESKEKSVGVITILKVIKGLFVSLIITFASIILFAFTIKWANLNDNIISEGKEEKDFQFCPSVFHKVFRHSRSF